MARLVREFLEPPVNGLDTDTPPHLMRRGYAPVHKNFLVNYGGRLPVRGLLRRWANGEIDSAGTAVITGVWNFDETLLIGLHDKTGNHQPPWNGPWSRNIGIADPELTMKTLTAGSGNADADLVAADAERVIKGRGARMGAYVYGYGYTGTADANNLPLTKFLRWDGNPATVPTEYANAPEGGQDVIAHLNRLWVLAGADIPGGGTDIELSALYFSDQDGPTADTAAMWQDDATGLVNKIVVQADDDDFGVGLAIQGQSLVIFKRRSIHVLYGYSPSTFQLRTITREEGCIDARTIVERDEGVYFLSAKGFRLFNGSSVVPVDDGVSTAVATASLKSATSSSHVPVAFATDLPNDYILLVIQDQNYVTGQRQIAYPHFSGLYHAPTGRWSRFSSTLMAESNTWAMDVPLLAGRAGNEYYMFDSRWHNNPEAITKVDAVGANGYGADYDGTDETPIPFELELRTAELASPGDMAQLHRLLIDYRWILDGAAEADTTGTPSGPRVDVVDAAGSTIVSDFGLPGSADGTIRRRFVKDVFQEAADIRVRFSAPDTMPAMEIPDLVVNGPDFQGVTVEYQPTRQARGS